MRPSPPAAMLLIVDDDRSLLRRAARVLERAGHVVATAASGAEAIASVKASLPDLLLLGLNLKDFDARKLIRRLSSLQCLPPFLILAGQGEERAAVKWLKSGARDYLVKGAGFLKLLPAVVGRALEVTERKRLEGEVLRISEMEQRRIGQDLHDGICQQLAGIELKSQSLVAALGKKSKAQAAQAEQIAGLVREVIAQTRSLARGLSPFILEAGDCVSALKELAANTEKLFNVKCRFQAGGPVSIGDPAVGAHLFRIAQEAVANAVKHGRAGAIEISLTNAGGKTVLAVSDNGTGLKSPPQAAGGMGLRTMQYRAGMIGATLRAQAQAGGGTRILCSFPNPASPPLAVCDSFVAGI